MNMHGWVESKENKLQQIARNIPHPCPMCYVSWGEIAQAFSHFTFDESHRELLVVDIQGVPSGEVEGSGIKLHLTDPQAGQMHYIYIYIKLIYIIYILFIYTVYTQYDHLIVFQRINLLNWSLCVDISSHWLLFHASMHLAFERWMCAIEQYFHDRTQISQIFLVYSQAMFHPNTFC